MFGLNYTEYAKMPDKWSDDNVLGLEIVLNISASSIILHKSPKGIDWFICIITSD